MKENPYPQDQSSPGEYRIVLNHENEYAIWPEARALPDGWQTTGYTGTKAECLAYLQLSPQSKRLASIRHKTPTL